MRASFGPNVPFRPLLDAMKDAVVHAVVCCTASEMAIIGHHSGSRATVYSWITAKACKRYVFPTVASTQPIVFPIHLPTLAEKLKASKKKMSNTITMTLQYKNEPVPKSTGPLAVQRAKAKKQDEDKGGDEEEEDDGDDDEDEDELEEEEDDDDDDDKPEKQGESAAAVAHAAAEDDDDEPPMPSHLLLEFVNDATGEVTLPPVSIPLAQRRPAFLFVDDLPNILHAHTLELPSHELKRMCLEHTIMGTRGRMSLSEGTFEMQSFGATGRGSTVVKGRSRALADEYNEGDIYATCPRSFLNTVLIRMQAGGVGDDEGTKRIDKTVEHTFSLPILNSFTKPSQLTPRVTLGFTPGKPLIVQYKIPGFALLSYYLPPL